MTHFTDKTTTKMIPDNDELSNDNLRIIIIKYIDAIQKLKEKLRTHRIYSIAITIICTISVITTMINIYSTDKTIEKMSEEYSALCDQFINYIHSTENINDFNIDIDETSSTEYHLPNIYDDIPLDDDLKAYIYASSLEANIPPEILYSIAWKESNYNPTVKSATDDYGMFQINIFNFDWLANTFGYTYDEFCEKIYDPYVNVDCAILILTDYRDNYNADNWHHVLMRYNMGPSKTNDLFNQGIYSTKYSRSLLTYAEETFGFTDIELK